MFELTDYLEKNLDRQIDFIRASETRLRFLVPMISLSLAAWATAFRVADIGAYSNATAGIVSIFLIVLSLFFCYRSVFPNLRGAENSNIFFYHICQKSFSEFRCTSENMSEKEYNRDLIEQCYVNARIANSKFKNISRAMLSWFLSLVPLTVFLVLQMDALKNVGNQ
ncbi:MAG: hypothetical protein JXJ18_03505 [Rhodobacteraceae bacterium]|nr:hypothetical protein [Paracoccaceae bacterium]